MPWYWGITGYQWLVLTIASLGWIFDVFEGQVLLSSEKQMLDDLVGASTAESTKELYKNLALAAFLAGGALGGVAFGALADRIGRVRTMTITILMYSLFTCLTAAAQTWWQVVVFRFLVALGVGGEWAVASALVAEVFPPRARAWSGAIFHGSSVLGTYLAVAAGAFIVRDPEWGWRWAFAIGAAPALLTLWIRWQLREPEIWLASGQRQPPGETAPSASDAATGGDAVGPSSLLGRLGDLFAPEIAGRTLLGFSLAVIGLATFWGVHIQGKELMLRRARSALEQDAGLPPSAAESQRQAVWQQHEEKLKSWEMLGMFLTTTGGGLGLLAFGPVGEWLGRRWAFVIFHLGGLAAGLVTFLVYRSCTPAVLGGLLVLFGFWTLGMHAGYAIYFPELFPTRLRSLGAGFCFNFARITTAAMLVLSGYLQRAGVPLETSAIALSLLFVVGAIVAWNGPETKGTSLA